MSNQQEWYHGAVPSEFWTIHRGWRVFVRFGLFGWRWSIMRDDGIAKGSIEISRPAAEAAAFAAVDRRCDSE